MYSTTAHYIISRHLPRQTHGPATFFPQPRYNALPNLDPEAHPPVSLRGCRWLYPCSTTQGNASCMKRHATLLLRQSFLCLIMATTCLLGSLEMLSLSRIYRGGRGSRRPKPIKAKFSKDTSFYEQGQEDRQEVGSSLIKQSLSIMRKC